MKISLDLNNGNHAKGPSEDFDDLLGGATSIPNDDNTTGGRVGRIKQYFNFDIPSPRIFQRQAASTLPPEEIEILEQEKKYLKVLPVLFYEYLALSIARALLPGMLNEAFGIWTYHVLGIVETVKGILAFVSCPLFGKLSESSLLF